MGSFLGLLDTLSASDHHHERSDHPTHCEMILRLERPDFDGLRLGPVKATEWFDVLVGVRDRWLFDMLVDSTMLVILEALKQPPHEEQESGRQWCNKYYPVHACHSTGLTRCSRA